MRGFGLRGPGRGIDRPKRSGRGRELRHARVDWQFRLVHAAELFHSHVYVHERLSGARNVEEGVAGANDLAQARSDGEDEVGLTHALRELRTRPDGEVARIARVEVIDAVLAAKRAGGREPVGLGKRDDVANRLRRPRAAAEQHQRPSRSGEQLAQPRHLGRTRACLHRFVGCGIDRRRGLAQHVFGEHDHHRAGPSGSRQRKRSRRQLRDAGRVVDLHHPLGHLAVHPAEVELLERPAPKKGARDLADEEDHRRRVLIGRVHADARVGRARTARNETDARPASEFAVGFGHVGGAAFLPAHDEADLLARVIERVEHGEVALARHAVGGVDAVDEELIDEDLCAGAGRVVRRSARIDTEPLPRRLPGLSSVLLSAMS